MNNLCRNLIQSFFLAPVRVTSSLILNHSRFSGVDLNPTMPFVAYLIDEFLRPVSHQNDQYFP